MFWPTPFSVLPLLSLSFYVPMISADAAPALCEKHRTTLKDECVSKSPKD